MQLLVQFGHFLPFGSNLAYRVQHGGVVSAAKQLAKRVGGKDSTVLIAQPLHVAMTSVEIVEYGKCAAATAPANS